MLGNSGIELKGLALRQCFSPPTVCVPIRTDIDDMPRDADDPLSYRAREPDRRVHVQWSISVWT